MNNKEFIKDSIRRSLQEYYTRYNKPLKEEIDSVKKANAVNMAVITDTKASKKEVKELEEKIKSLYASQVVMTFDAISKNEQAIKDVEDTVLTNSAILFDDVSKHEEAITDLEDTVLTNSTILFDDVSKIEDNVKNLEKISLINDTILFDNVSNNSKKIENVKGALIANTAIILNKINDLSELKENEINYIIED